MKKNKGITLIALIITIIVLLILAGVSIAMLTGESGVITQAQKAKISTELSGYKEELELYKISKLTENQEFLDGSLTAGKTNLSYNTQKAEETGNIKTVITSISDEYMEKLEIIKGELLINTKSKDEIKIAQSLGIEVNPYDITEEGELLSSNGNLLLMDENGTLTIPDSVTKIGEGAFANCSGLKTVIIPGSVKEIGTNAFAYNQTLETVIMQEGVEIIGDGAFMQCRHLKNVDMPQSLLKIKGSAFMAAQELSKITIPTKITSISGYSFYQCTNLTEIKLSENIKEITEYAFSFTAFESIVIPESVEKISKNVFSGNKNLDTIVIEGKEPKFVYENGMLMPKEKNNVLFASDKYLKGISTFEIPEGVDEFSLMLEQYRNINKLIIPNSLTKMLLPREWPPTIQEVEVKGENKRFKVDEKRKILYTQDTKELNMCFSKEENIDLLDENNEIGIKSIYDSAFQQATKAKNIVLPKSTTLIGAFAFQNCVNLEDVKIGENVSSIDGLFKYLNYAGEVIIDPNNPYFKVENNVLYTKDKSEIVCVLYPIVGTFYVDSSVKILRDRAFHNQYQMTDIRLPEGLTKIGECLNFCTSLTELNIPSTVESISEKAFINDPNISQINIQKPKDSIPGAPWGAPKGMKVVNWKK